MKKIIIICSTFAVLSSGLLSGIKTHKQNNENAMLLANLEALTNPEETKPDPEKGDNSWITSHSVGSIRIVIQEG